MSDFIYNYPAKMKSAANLVDGIKKVVIFGKLYDKVIKLFQSDDEPIFKSAETQN